jgi:hypothetical protein
MSRAAHFPFFEPVFRRIDLLLQKAEQFIAWERRILGMVHRSETHHDLVNLPEAAERVSACHASTARRKLVSLLVEVAPDAIVVGNSPALCDMLRRLIAAAIEKASTGSQVTIVGSALGRVVTLTFSNDAPKNAPEDWKSHCSSALSWHPNPKPFVDNAPFDQIEDVVTCHGGTIQMIDHPSGGFSWRVTLPVSA